MLFCGSISQAPPLDSRFLFDVKPLRYAKSEFHVVLGDPSFKARLFSTSCTKISLCLKSA